MRRPLSNFLRAGDWSPAEGRSQSARREGLEARPARAPAAVQVGGWRGAASGLAGRAGTRCAAGQLRGQASMRRDRAAARRALLSPSPPLLLLLPLLLSRAAALYRGELFPYGQSLGDRLLQEGDDESSAAVTLASPLRFYEAQFSYLYVSSASSGCRGSRFLAASSRGVQVVWLAPSACLQTGGTSRPARLCRSAPGRDLALQRGCHRTRCVSLPRGRERALS